MTLAGAVDAAMHRDSARTGDRVVLRDGTVDWDARTLLSAIDRVADELRALQLPRNARVAVLLPSGAPLIAAFLAAGEVPLTPVVLDASWDDGMLCDVLGRLQPDAMLTDRPGRDRLAARLSEAGSGRCVPPVAVNIEVLLDRLLTEPSALRRTLHSLSAVRDDGDVDGVSVTPTTPAPTRTSTHVVLMTSGSTGPPKGVRRSHTSWLRSFEATREMGPVPADRVAVPGSLASSWFLYAAIEGLCTGAAVRVWPSAEVAEIIDELGDWQVTRVAVVPALLERCVASARRRGIDLPALQRIVSCGGIWPSGLRARTLAIAPQARIHDVYGAAEWSVVSVREITRGSENADLGRPVPGVDISLRDEQGQPVSDAEAGMLWVRSPLTFEGYVGGEDPRKLGSHDSGGPPPGAMGEVTGNDATRDAEGFIAVGDVVRYAGGRLSLVGRRDHVLVCRGSKVHPELIERALCEFDGVTAAAVTLATDPRRGEHLVALLQGAVEVTRGELRRHARHRLPAAARPARLLLVSHLPRTHAGKLDRDRLPALIPSARPMPASVTPAVGSSAP
jgi:long-chain acyl-CoA synthetase